MAKCVSAIYGQDGTGPLSKARPLRLHTCNKKKKNININRQSHLKILKSMNIYVSKWTPEHGGYMAYIKRRQTIAKVTECFFVVFFFFCVCVCVCVCVCFSIFKLVRVTKLVFPTFAQFKSIVNSSGKP